MIEVAAAVIIRDGRVLAARRTHPPHLAGRWELPGGKPAAAESVAETLVREIREELDCTVSVVATLPGRTPISPGHVLTAHEVRIVSGEPRPREHDAIRWLGPEELDDVDWLPPDRPFLPEIGSRLAQGTKLEGGNVRGAVRIGRTVRRIAGPWTPAVHALLDHLAAVGLRGTPRVLGFDSSGREALSYLPGRVPDVDTEVVGRRLLASAMTWLCAFHDAVEPWAPGGGSQVICHHDFAPYNVAVAMTEDGERLAGVFDWDLAGPGTRLDDLAFAAWNWIPLYRPLPVEQVAERLEVLCAGYGRDIAPVQVAIAVVPRIERSIEWVRAGQLAGDPGMHNLAALGEPGRTIAALEALKTRLPSVLEALGD